MGSEWPTVPLGQLIEPGRVLTYGVVQPGSPVPDGVPIVRVADMRDGRVSTSGVLRISREIEAPYGRSRLRGGELLLTVVGTVGETVVAPDALAGWNTARGVAVIPVRKDVGAAWVRLALQGPEARSAIHSRLNTTVQPTLNLDDVARLPIPMPPTKERQRVLRHIGALDDKIELNRRMSQTLESMARALFKSWFVDFDPVRSRAEGRACGLPKQVADLFPESFDDADLGEIPDGWTVAALSQLAEVRGGSQLPAGELQAVGTGPVYGANGLMGYAERKTHDGFVIAFGRVGAYCGSIHWTYDGAWINNNASSIEPARWPEFVLLSLLQVDFYSMRTGSAQPFIPNGALSTTEIIQPPPLLTEEFCRVVRPAWRQRWELERNSFSLASVRDALLPELLSGGLLGDAAVRPDGAGQ
jgi:type I restriction enzyme S subunit